MSKKSSNIAPLAALGVGILLILISFVMPTEATTSNWTEDMEKEYQKVSATIHAHGHDHSEDGKAHKVKKGEEGKADAALQEAKTRFAELDGQLQSARGSRRWMQFLVQWGGAAVAVAGIALYLVGRQS